MAEDYDNAYHYISAADSIRSLVDENSDSAFYGSIYDNYGLIALNLGNYEEALLRFKTNERIYIRLEKRKRSYRRK
ncbi:MAG: hypothetical protein MK078_09210 [Crocinitomicaceae bacterium]|nr:hypothetical protein [Crocinitomicaceae bacterium]